MLNRFNTPNVMDSAKGEDGRRVDGFIWHLEEGQYLPGMDGEPVKEGFRARILGSKKKTALQGESGKIRHWEGRREWHDHKIEGPCTVIAKCNRKGPHGGKVGDINNPPWEIIIDELCMCRACKQQIDNHGRRLLAPEYTLLIHVVESGSIARILQELTGRTNMHHVIRHSIMLELLPWADGVTNEDGKPRPLLTDLLSQVGDLRVGMKEREGDKYKETVIDTLLTHIQKARAEMDALASGETKPRGVINHKELLAVVASIDLREPEDAEKDLGPAPRLDAPDDSHNLN